MTAYNSSYAYNAPIRYDGVGATATTSTTTGPLLQQIRRPHQTEPDLEVTGTVHGVSASHARITYRVDTTAGELEDLQLLDLI